MLEHARSELFSRGRPRCLGALMVFLTAVRSDVDAAVAYHGGDTEEYLGELDGLRAVLRKNRKSLALVRSLTSTYACLTGAVVIVEFEFVVEMNLVQMGTNESFPPKSFVSLQTKGTYSPARTATRNRETR